MARSLILFLVLFSLSLFSSNEAFSKENAELGAIPTSNFNNSKWKFEKSIIDKRVKSICQLSLPNTNKEHFGLEGKLVASLAKGVDLKTLYQTEIEIKEEIKSKVIKKTEVSFQNQKFSFNGGYFWKDEAKDSNEGWEVQVFKKFVPGLKAQIGYTRENKKGIILSQEDRLNFGLNWIPSRSTRFGILYLIKEEKKEDNEEEMRLKCEWAFAKYARLEANYLCRDIGKKEDYHNLSLRLGLKF